MAHDVVVLGATIAGLTAARRLASQGVDVLVLDPNQESASADIGHGVAASAHASTVANMGAAYGPVAVAEHVRRNLAGMEEIRQVCASGDVPVMHLPLHDHSLGFALERELTELANQLNDAGAAVSVLSPDRRQATAGIVSDAMCVDSATYAAALAQQASTMGALIRYDTTVVKLARRDGESLVAFRDNIEWSQHPYVVAASAVIDTMGVSPWGATAGVGTAQFVPRIVCRSNADADAVTLASGPPVWMIRPLPDGRTLLLGPKADTSNAHAVAADLRRWAESQLEATEVDESTLVIDPSDHGRPVVGVSAIPGGYYTRGNGRGELMNGTASGTWLAAVLMGEDPGTKQVSLPRLARWRAHLRGALRR